MKTFDNKKTLKDNNKTLKYGDSLKEYYSIHNERLIMYVRLLELVLSNPIDSKSLEFYKANINKLMMLKDLINLSNDGNSGKSF